MRHHDFLGIALLSVGLAACGKPDRHGPVDTLAITVDSGPRSHQTNPAPSAMSFSLKSPAFAPNGPIPAKYTCEGADVSPPLEWSGAPSGTGSLALIVDDPDAPDPAKPQRVYVHWVVYNIPASAANLPENAGKRGLPPGAVQGSNDWRKQTYGGPCPPIGSHRYFFKLYALDAELTGLNKPTKVQLEKAMQPHIVGTTELMGTYEKQKK